MQYLDESDWAEFREKNSAAYHWLLGRDLLRELQHWRKIRESSGLDRWQFDRLAELEQWADVTAAEQKGVA
jgi:hypothetical protein